MLLMDELKNSVKVSIPSLRLLSMYRFEKNTLISRVNDFKIEVGDSKQKDFFPQMKLIRSIYQTNEANFSIRLEKDLRGAKVHYHDNKIFQSFPDGTIVRMYDRGFGCGGGHELDIWIPQKPRNNIVPFTVRSKGLIFHPQRTLKNINSDGSSWEPNETGGNCYRPVDINESIAVYFTDGKINNKYKSGKAFHIKRPYATDARDCLIWCDFVLDDQRRPIGIRIPNRAVYPIQLDPILGYSDNGNTPNDIISTYIFTTSGNAFQATENGTITDINVYGTTPYGDKDITLGLYVGTGDNPAGKNRLAVTAGGIISSPTVPATFTQSVSFAIVNGDKYYFAMEQSGTWQGYYDDDFVSGGSWFAGAGALSYTSGSLANPFPSTDGVAAGKIFTGYANYTSGGGGPTNLGLSTIGRGAFEGMMRGGR